jgi:hypothetical protein
MLEPDFDPAPDGRSNRAMRVIRARVGCRGATRRATIVLRKVDVASRPVRQIELCDRHAQLVIARERARGFEIQDRRDWR